MTLAPTLPPARAAVLSDRGYVRADNQDACLIAPECGLFALADGMGGRAAGGVAARIVLMLLPALVLRALDSADKHADTGDFSLALRDAVRRVNVGLRRRGERTPSLEGLGSTLVALILRGSQAYVVHLGDSRAYLLRQGALIRLTVDHNLAAHLLESRQITLEQAARHPGRHQLTRFAGQAGDPEPDIRVVQAEPGDRFLLCSDGLTSMLGDATIERRLRPRRPPEVTCRALVDAAKAAGGRDNVSVAIVDLASVQGGRSPGSAARSWLRRAF